MAEKFLYRMVSSFAKRRFRITAHLAHTKPTFDCASPIGGIYVYCIVPVSYTHLDVYKRQGMWCAICFAIHSAI